jgi:uncharacterized damage-inducible protein DinB
LSEEQSILETLGHIYGAEKLWLERVTGQSAVWAGGGSVEELRLRWPLVSAGWGAWAVAAEPDSEIDYRDLKGNPHKDLVWQIVFHVVNHSTHHRGQVAAFFRALGIVPPTLDLIAFVRGFSRRR